MTTKTKISVALCTYNGEKYIEAQLDSIFNQTMRVDEINICDDGSGDNTVSIIKIFQKKYPGVVSLHINETNLGVVKNFEKAIRLCSGDIIFLSDQDDEWVENKVEECMAYFNNNPGVLGCFTDAFIINADNKILDKTLWESILFDAETKNENLFKFLLFYRNAVTGACLVIKRESLPYIIPFVKIGKMLHDEWAGLKLAEKNLLGNINKPLIKYRIHNSQQTGLPAENYDNNYLNIRTAIFKNDFTSYPLYHYYHWMTKLKSVPSLTKFFKIPPAFVSEMKTNRLISLKTYFNNKSFLVRKTELAKWLFKKNNDITIKDFLAL